jgi:hypothetical protein
MATLWGDDGNTFVLESHTFVLRGNQESLINYLQIKFNELMYTRLQVGFGGNAGSGSTTAAR